MTARGRALRSRPASGASPAQRSLVLAGLVGPLAYLTLVAVLGLLVDGYDPVRSSMSELGAIDSPFRQVMNVAGFMGVGAAILAFAAGCHLQLRPSRPKTAVTGLLGVAGVFMIAVGFFPCDPGCVDVTAIGRLHSLTSIPQAIALPAAAMLSALAFRADGRVGPGWQAFSFWSGLVALGTGPLVGTDAVAALGLVQRVGMGLSLLWMILVAVKLYRLTADPPAAQSEPDRRQAASPERGVVARLRAVTKRYGSVTALESVDLDVGAGGVVGLRQAAGAGKTILLTSHYLEEVEALADRVVVLAAGRIVADGSVEDVRGLVGLSRVAFDVDAGVDLTALPHVARVERHGGRVELLTGDADVLVRALVDHDIGFRRLEVRSASLEEAFLALTEPGGVESR